MNLFLNTLKRGWARINSVLKGGLRLHRRNRFIWLFHFIHNRYRYNLRALYSGMRMNDRGLGALWNFRRNIHRLEKGSLPKKQKALFAEDYILETVHYFEQILASPMIDHATVMWGKAVLDWYFETCQRTGRVADAFERYRNLSTGHGHVPWHSYSAKDRPELSVGYESLYRLALRRRSVRFYLDRIVELEAIEPAMRIAALSPSACNRQSYRFLFHNDKETVGKIAQLPGGLNGYEVPSIVTVIASYRGYFDERDFNVPIIDASLAVMSFLFALETLGLSSVCMNWPSLPDHDKQMRKLIPLDDDEVIVMLIGVGYPAPDGKVAYSAKRDVSDLIKWDKHVE